MPTRMSDGYNLEENCTKCHRGSNAFVTRLGTPLNVSAASFGGLDTVPARRYEPLSGNPADTNWVNPISTVHPNMGGCLGGGCHDVNNEIAQPSYDYCLGILQNIIGTEMPPGGVFDSADISALVTACRTEGFTLNVISQ
jgi:hypothetical protein